MRLNVALAQINPKLADVPAPEVVPVVNRETVL